MKKRWYLFTIGVGMLCLILLATACQGGYTQTSPEYTQTSPSEVYQSVADFYSLANDRSDVEEGTFKIWPELGEKISLTGVVESFYIYEHTEKHIENGVLTIEKKYDLMVSLSKEVVSISVNPAYKDADVSVPVIFCLEIGRGITKQVAEQLKSIKVGEEVSIKGERGIISYQYNGNFHEGSDRSSLGHLNVIVGLEMQLYDSIRGGTVMPTNFHHKSIENIFNADISLYPDEINGIFIK